MTRLAVLSDIHGNLPALQAVVADFERQGVDQVVTLGDHASGPLWPAETLAFLMAQPWVQIAGNHEQQLLHHPPERHNLSDQYAYARLDPPARAWLAALPLQLRIGSGPAQADILLCHGAPGDENCYLLETVAGGYVRQARPAEIRERLAGAAAALLLCGHTHVPRCIEVAPGTLVVNPGSVGVQAYTDTLPLPHVVETGAPHARYAIVEHTSHGWQARLMAVPYDHTLAAGQAARNGRPEWAQALRTGWLSG